MRQGYATKALAAAVTAALAAALTAGCSDRTLDSGLIGSLTGPQREIPDSPIRPMAGTETAYPNLATVPPRPTDIPTVGERQSDMDALERDRAAARAAAEALERDLGPLRAPPRPDIVPGRPAQKNP
ncbi:hypothetical protein [Azospirillum halopraeferens]|uniref:hypothetical protein n=1 Tax=Azospirillum halopraeferens TaxID=34010 RepID=UPI00040E23F6|nr:hypothetical protein [Azospirillum halopraeferens]